MMKKFNVLCVGFIAAVLTLAGCESAKVREVAINNKFAMDLPEYLTPQNDLNEDASLTYAHLGKELYVMVIEDTQAELDEALSGDPDSMTIASLGDFAALCASDVDEGFLSESLLAQLKPTTLNGLEAQTAEAEGCIDNIAIYYSATVVKGRDTYYQIYIWTLADRKEKHAETMRTMLGTFREL